MAAAQTAVAGTVQLAAVDSAADAAGIAAAESAVSANEDVAAASAVLETGTEYSAVGIGIADGPEC